MKTNNLIELKKVLTYILILFVLVSTLVLASVGYAVAVVREKINQVDINTLANIADCNIEFKDLKYSGICTSEVIEAVTSYGGAQITLDCISKLGYETCLRGLK